MVVSPVVRHACDLVLPTPAVCAPIGMPEAKASPTQGRLSIAWKKNDLRCSWLKFSYLTNGHSPLGECLVGTF